jgi:hypothetical protein
VGEGDFLTMPAQQKQANGGGESNQEKGGVLDVAQLLQNMKENLAIAEIQAREGRLLLNYLSTVPKKSWPDMARVPQVLIASMKAHPVTSGLLRIHCASLHWINRQSGINTGYMKDPETFLVIRRTFMSNPDDIVLQSIAIRVMVDVMRVFQFQFPSSLSEAISKSGILSAAFRFLDAHIQHAEAQFLGVRFAGCVLHIAQDTSHTTKYVRDSNISVALRAMRTHGSNMFVLWAGMEVLLMVLERSRATADTIWRQGGMRCVIAAINACLLADKCTVFEPPAICKFALIQTSDSNDELRLLGFGAQMIHRLYEYGTKPRCAETDLNVIARAMSRFLQDRSLQESGIIAYSFAMSACKDNVEHAGPQGMSAILAAMSTHQHMDTKGESLQALGLNCLSEMTVHTQIHKLRMISDGGLDIVGRIMEACANSKIVTADAIQAIYCVGQRGGRELQETMILLGNCKMVAKAMISHSDVASRQEVARRGCLCLTNVIPLFLSQDLIDRLVHDKVVDAILQAMREFKEHKSIQEHGSEVLCTLLLGEDEHIKTYNSQRLIEALWLLK